MDRWDDIVAAVDSARRQEPAAREVILVIDHNPALLERALALSGRAAPSPLVVVENTGSRGLSGARNTGVRAAAGAIIAFLDDDARAEPGWLAALVAPYEDPRVIGTGGQAVAAWAAGRPNWFPDEFDWVVGCSYRGLPIQEASIRNPLGCNMSFRRSVFEEVGGFRPEVGRIGSRPVGCEETELSIRALQRWPTGQILYVPSAVVRHRVPAVRAQVTYFRSRCYAEGQSKALVTVLAGGRVLGIERAYTLRVLPRGIARGIRDLGRGDVSGAMRAVLILFGLVMTTAGYIVGRTAFAVGRSRLADSGAEPIAPWNAG